LLLTLALMRGHHHYRQALKPLLRLNVHRQIKESSYIELTSSSIVEKRPHDALCLSVVSFNSTIPRAQFLLLLVTSASDLPVRTIRFCSVVFVVTSSLAVIRTIYVHCDCATHQPKLLNAGESITRTLSTIQMLLRQLISMILQILPLQM